jgi:hypothetical protein
MTYRDESVALRERIAELEKSVATERARVASLEQRIEAIARGDADPAIAAQMLSVRVTAVLLFATAAMAVAAIVAWWPLNVVERPRALAEAIAASSFATLTFIPLVVMCVLGGIGLWKGQRWGYPTAIAACVVACLYMCLPPGIIGLVLLLRRNVREAFFPTRSS